MGRGSEIFILLGGGGGNFVVVGGGVSWKFEVKITMS